MLTPANTSDLISLLEKAGYPRADAPLLHRADTFLDLSGEDIRRRLYLTQDAAGEELCLRPEFTIPLCLRHVGSGAGAVAAMSYCGPVFRHRAGESGEFIQAGIESLGRKDAEAADAEVLGLALDAARLLGQDAPAIRLGDAGLIHDVLESLSVSPAMARRIKRRLGSGQSVQEVLKNASGASGLGRYGGVMTALEGAEATAARAFVGDMLTISGVRASGGRSSEEIAERFLRKAREGDAGLEDRSAAVLAEYLSLSGHPDDVAVKVKGLAKKHGLDLAHGLERYESRIGFMAARGIDLAQVSASAGFVRNLDYYTGMVFEVAVKGETMPKPLIGGGRYDNLLKRLGAQEDVPAVGFSIWVERFKTNAADASGKGA